MTRFFVVLIVLTLGVSGATHAQDPMQPDQTPPGDTPAADAAAAEGATDGDSAETGDAAAAPPLPDGITPDQVAGLIATLEDEAARAELVTQLRLLTAAQDAEQPRVSTVIPALGAQVIETVSDQLAALNEEVTEIADAIADLPRLGVWISDQIDQPQARQRWIDIGQNVLLVLGSGIAAWLLLRLLLTPGRRRVEQVDRTTWTGRLATWFLWTVVQMLPVIGLWLSATAMIAAVPPSYYVRIVVVALLQAVLIASIIRTLAHALLAPGVPTRRLWRLDDTTARYLYVWIRRVTRVAVFGYFVAETSFILGLPFSVRNGVLAVVGLAVTVMLIVMILGRRHGVAAAIRGPDHGAAGVRAARAWIAGWWHVFAVLYVVAMYFLWVLEIGDGFAFLLRATVLSALTIIVARMAMIGWQRLIASVAGRPSDSMRGRYLRARLGIYATALSGFGRFLAVAASLVVLAEIWGLGGYRWLTDGWGQGLLVTLVTVVFIVSFSVLAWEAIRGAIERYLGETDATGAQVERSARVLTVLPLLRSAALVVLITVATLVVLSEIGINIAPLLAGAGVIGLAIGFGAQTLVQDVITGLFIILENTVSVGDVVMLGSHGGVVEAMNIRSIRLRDLSGNVHTIPFSQVSTVMNMTRDYSYYVFDIGVSYREDVDAVIGVIERLGAEMQDDPDYAREILAPIEILGVDSFGDSAVVIKARFKTRPIKQWMVGRDFNRRLKKRFDELGIEIPFPHVTLYFGVDKDGASPAANLNVNMPRLVETLAAGFERDARRVHLDKADREAPAQAGPADDPAAAPFRTPAVGGDEPAESAPGT